MLTIVFYATDGQSAKYRARAIVAESKGNYARCYDVASWDNTPDKCDAVEIMPDVPSWQKDRIMAVFGQVDEVQEQPAPIEDTPARQPMGLMPEKQQQNSAETELKAVHKGGGRWFVMNGEERVSGPHDKAEAMRLASAAA